MTRLKEKSLDILCGISFLALCMAFIGQYGFDLPPCRFCIYERYPYGIAFISSLVGMSQPSWLPYLQKLFFITFVAGTLLTATHVMIEHGWIPLPRFCTSDLTLNAETTVESLKLQMMEQPRVTPCHIAPLKIFGLSFAEYNLVLSLFLVWFCARFVRWVP
jgi:disulfide bond formation protein DsbB